MATIPVVSDGDVIFASTIAALAQAVNATVYDEGFLPFAYPIGFDPHVATGTQTNLAAVSSGKAGLMLVPFHLPAPMRIQSVSIRSSDTASARSCSCRIYRDVGTGVLQSACTVSAFSFTPSAASDRTTNVTTPGTLLIPGTYWVAFLNSSASQTFGIRRMTAVTELAANFCAQDNVPNATALGSTLDTSLLTLSGVSQAAVRLNGRVFGGSAAF